MHRCLRNILYSAWDVIAIKCIFFFSTLRSYSLLWFQGCRPAKGFKTSGKCYFKARKAGSIQLGENVTLLASSRSNRVGLMNSISLETLEGGSIEVGANSGGSAIVISSRAKVSIGRNVKLGGNVRIFDHDFHSLDPEIRRNSMDDIASEPISIGDDVFVGTNAMVLKGVTIGDRAIIAAGSIVTKDIPADEVWGGNPVRCLRAFSVDQREDSS